MIKSWLETTVAKVIVALAIVTIVLWLLGIKDFAFILAIVDIILSVYDVIQGKLQQITAIKEKISEYELFLDKVINADFSLISKIKQDIPEASIEAWKSSLINYAFGRFSKNLSLSSRDLTEITILSWMNLFFGDLSKYEAFRDFLIYSFLKENFERVYANFRIIAERLEIE